MRQATVLGHNRIILVLLFHCALTLLLIWIEYHDVTSSSTVYSTESRIQARLSTLKDLVDLFLTGIVFLLGGFVTQSLVRWWSIRKDGVGALWNAVCNCSLITTSMYPSSSPEHREARDLVTRYGLLALQLLFIEARAPEMSVPIEETVYALEANGLATTEERKVLQELPSRSHIALGWLAAFFEDALSSKTELACSISPTNCDNGRYSQIFAQLAKGREAINLVHSHLDCQLPYGYVHIILLTSHITALTNTVYCGLSMGAGLREMFGSGAGPAVYLPFILIELLRILFVPFLLDGMLVIGKSLRFYLCLSVWPLARISILTTRHVHRVLHLVCRHGHRKPAW